MGIEAHEGATENKAFSSALNEILSNPQMLSAISSMAERLKDGSAQPSESAESENKDKSAQKEDSARSEAPSSEEAALANAPQGFDFSSVANILGALRGSGKTSEAQSHRSELLCALKPYLSQSRGDAIDKIIRLTELSSLFGELK